MDQSEIPSAEITEMVYEEPPPSYDQVEKALQTIKCKTESAESTVTVTTAPAAPVLVQSEVISYGKWFFVLVHN